MAVSRRSILAGEMRMQLMPLLASCRPLWLDQTILVSCGHSHSQSSIRQISNLGGESGNEHFRDVGTIAQDKRKNSLLSTTWCHRIGPKTSVKARCSTSLLPGRARLVRTPRWQLGRWPITVRGSCRGCDLFGRESYLILWIEGHALSVSWQGSNLLFLVDGQQPYGWYKWSTYRQPTGPR